MITSHLRCTARDYSGVLLSSATARALTAMFTRTVKLDLAFNSEPLRTLCEKYAVAKHELGKETADALIVRLADLRAASSMNELVAGRPRFLHEATKPTVIVDLTPGYQLSFCANHITNPVTKNGELDWTRISRIKILDIGRTP